ncbi:hypothetical protein EXIGLDRAFT_744656 [Exidia glandulosa HHB12029]|uniref:Uncharacterized protein n=1 Tax=Exidia glandulosa HHB12029 TaxID=1314781 RepID=A0A165PH75_EXIGL|nr:hypothetical protein EXIGLDRAFT_744656 [Exidia glandulosa HHB12029]
MSHFTTQSTTSLVHRHDGHHEGYLNCIAVRHGWTRTFSIAPGQLDNLDYAQLEKVLELNTLKLRPYMVRIFVEEPANSGTYAKVRFWKDDGSLQSVLVKEFFEKRMNEGGITTFELRDGRERANEDDTDAESAFASKTSLALSKLRRRKTARSTDSTPAPTPSIKTGTARFFDFFRLPGNIKPAPPPSMDIPLGIDDDDDEEDELPPRAADPEEQALLQRRGWMPPLLRRITGQTTATPDAAATGSIRRRSKGKGREMTDMEPGDEDAVALSEEEWEVQDQVPDAPAGPNGSGSGRPALFARLSGRNKEEQSIGLKKEKSKNKNKNKNKGAKGGKTAFQGAERVQRPEDALPPPPPSKGEGSSTAKNPFDD